MPLKDAATALNLECKRTYAHRKWLAQEEEGAGLLPPPLTHAEREGGSIRLGCCRDKSRTRKPLRQKRRDSD